MPLDLGRVDPSDKVFHVARDEEGRVRDGVGTDADVALLHIGDSLRRESKSLRSVEGRKNRRVRRVTDHLDGLCHLEADHDDG